MLRGHRAIAAGLQAGVAVAIRPGSGAIHAARWQLEAKLFDDSPVSRALSAIVERLCPGVWDIEIDSELPCGAGLGSSAALSVATARALAGGELDDPRVVRAVEEAERVFHGRSSGVDAAAALNGGVGEYRMSSGWRPLRTTRALQVCVGVSGKTHRTHELVGDVIRRCDEAASARRLVEELGAIAERGLDAVASSDHRSLGALLDQAHGLLAELGLSSPALDDMVKLAREAGAWGAKLTGAGGGGAVIAIPSSSPAPILSAWRTAGYACFQEELHHA